VGRFFVFEHFQKRIDKAEYTTGIQPFGGNAGVFDKSKMSAINERESIQEEKFFIGFHCVLGKFLGKYRIMNKECRIMNVDYLVLRLEALK
jgi:hypothetical protein